MDLCEFSSERNKFRYFEMPGVDDKELYYLKVSPFSLKIPVIRFKKKQDVILLPWTVEEGAKLWKYAWIYHFVFTPLFARQSVTFYSPNDATPSCGSLVEVMHHIQKNIQNENAQKHSKPRSDEYVAGEIEKVRILHHLFFFLYIFAAISHSQYSLQLKIGWLTEPFVALNKQPEEKNKPRKGPLEGKKGGEEEKTVGKQHPRPESSQLPMAN